MESSHPSTEPQGRKRWGRSKFPLPESYTAICSLELRTELSLLGHKKGLKRGSRTQRGEAPEVLYRRHDGEWEPDYQGD